MQMGFCGENFRRQRRDRGNRKNEEKREREEGEEKKNVAVKESKEEERRILGRVEAGGESVSAAAAASPPPLRRHGIAAERARIIFTEIKSKIRLALKCALDRARPNRRWLKRALPQLVAGSARIRRGREDVRPR